MFHQVLSSAQRSWKYKYGIGQNSKPNCRSGHEIKLGTPVRSLAHVIVKIHALSYSNPNEFHAELWLSLDLQLGCAVKFKECPNVIGLHIPRGQQVHQKLLLSKDRRSLGGRTDGELPCDFCLNELGGVPLQHQKTEEKCQHQTPEYINNPNTSISTQNHRKTSKIIISSLQKWQKNSCTSVDSSRSM